jgi:hypothetical protein
MTQISIQQQVAAMFDAANNSAAIYRKPANKKQQAGNQAATEADRATNRRAATAIIDSRLRSFKQTCKAIWESRQQPAVTLYLADKKLSAKRFADYKQLAEYLKANLPTGGSYAVNSAGQLCKAVVSIGTAKPDGSRTDNTALHTALGWDIIHNSENGTAKALQPLTVWSVADLINCTSLAVRTAAKNSKQPAVQTDSILSAVYVQHCLAQVK